MNEQAARERFETVISEQKPEFENFFLAKFLGLSFEYPDDRCVIRFPVHEYMFNPRGTLHGGVIATVMDISMGHLLKRTMDVAGATLEMKIQFLAPITPPMARCEAQFLRRGGSISFLESRMWNHANELAAVATATWKPAKPAGSAR